MRLHSVLPISWRRPMASWRLTRSLGFVVLAAALLLPATKAWANYRAAIVIDMNSGKVLYQHDADVPRAPASLTKMMTLYLLFSYLRDGRISLDSPLMVTPHAAGQAPTKLGLIPGHTIRTEDAIKSLVTQSANDAAVCIAENLAGTETNFARMMTAEARKLGMRHTIYHNASGLPTARDITTARDTAILAEHLQHDFPQYFHYFSIKRFTYHGRTYLNHNHLLFNYRGTDGIKTGYTRAAGFNLVADVHRNGRHLLAVVLGGSTSRSRDASMRYLLTRYFRRAVVGGRQQIASNSNPGLPLRRPEMRRPATPPLPPIDNRQPVRTVSYRGGPTTLNAQARQLAEETGHVDPVTRAPARERLPERQPEPADAHGAYQVQVGAYASAQDAVRRLAAITRKAPSLLAGHMPVTSRFDHSGRQWYRARFASFSERDAEQTCSSLRRLRVSCIAVRTD